jgi:hypothetical protein
MRHGPWRTLSALVSGTAFAVTVAGPVQWDPCPMHGAAVHALVEDAPPAPAAMAMAAGGEMPATAVHAHATHGAPDSHHAGHQCTCPGGCCSTTPVGLGAPPQRARLGIDVEVPARLPQPTDAVEVASRPQLALPFAQAPPSIQVTPHHAAHSLT